MKTKSLYTSKIYKNLVQDINYIGNRTHELIQQKKKHKTRHTNDHMSNALNHTFN